MTKTSKKIDKFSINLHCAIISTDIPVNKKYVLSTDKNLINLPIIKFNKNIKNNIDEYLIKELRSNYIFVNELELMPQLISLHYAILEKNENEIDVLYGFLVNHTNNINDNNCYWVEFDYLETNTHTLLLCDVIQRLR